VPLVNCCASLEWKDQACDVKVMTGQNADETGLVVSVANNVVTFLSDMYTVQCALLCGNGLPYAALIG
jgi:transcription elongation factor SPT5